MDRKLSRRHVLQIGTASAGLWLAENTWGATPKRRVIVWSEATAPKGVYPNDINGAVADGLKQLQDWDVVTTSINDPEQGLSEIALQEADVLIWWGHNRHDEVHDGRVVQIVRRVRNEGLGFIALHSAHWSKPFKRLLDTSGDWRGGYHEDGSSVHVTIKDKGHPIAQGVSDFTLPKTERYSEPFLVPKPEAVVFDGVYTLPNGGEETSRQGAVWTIGNGRVFYFQPGHETYPTFFDANVRRILRNAVRWAGEGKGIFSESAARGNSEGI